MMLEVQELARPFQKFSHGLVAHNIKLLETAITYSFTVFIDTAKLMTNVLSDRIPWLVKTEKALGTFKERIDKITTIKGFFCNMREARIRTPSGHITEIQVIIPNSNRETEYKIYDAFGELLRTSSPLLFDLHITKLKGRRLEEVVPEGFWRYE